MEHLLHAIVTLSRMQNMLQQIWFTPLNICTGKNQYMQLKICATFFVDGEYYLKPEPPFHIRTPHSPPSHLVRSRSLSTCTCPLHSIAVNIMSPYAERTGWKRAFLS